MGPTGRSAPPPRRPSDRADAPALHRAPIRILFPPSLGQLRASVRAELLSTTLSARLRRPVLVEVAESYEELERQVLEASVEVAWAPPALCAKAEPTARAILRATRGGRSEYHSALICRADEPLSVDSLGGRRAAWVDRRSTGGYLLAVSHLRKLGRPPNKVLASESFFGSYEAALRAVLTGEADLTAIYVPDVDHDSVRAVLTEQVGEDEERLVAFEVTAASPTDGLVITSRTPPLDAQSLVEAILPDKSTKGPPTLLQVCDADSFALAKPGEFAALEEALTPVSFASEGISVPGREPREGANAAMIAAPKPLVLRLHRSRRCVEVLHPAGATGANELRGEKLEKIFGEQVGRQIEDAIDRASARREPAHVGFAVETIGGRAYLDVDVTLDAKGAAGTGEIALVVSDVSERKRLEVELLAYASYPTIDPDPCFDLSIGRGDSGLVVTTNPAARKMFPDLVSRRDHPLLRALAPFVEDAQKSAESCEGEVRIGERALHVTVTKVPDGRTLRVYASTSRAARSANDRRDAIGHIARSIAEEVALVTRSLDLVSEEVCASGETGEHLDSVMRAIDEGRDANKRLVTIVEKLDVLAKKSSLARPIELRDVLEQAIALFPDLGRRAELVRDFGTAPKVFAIEEDLVLAFLALLVNASRSISRAGPRKRRHSVRLVVRTDAAHRAVVEVCDSGAGIPEDRIARVFEDPELGLASSSATIRGLGGDIAVDSQVGQGTTFSIALPPGETDEGLPRRSGIS